MVRELEGVQPNRDVQIVLSFLPAVNNAMINAIEIEPS